MRKVSKEDKQFINNICEVAIKYRTKKDLTSAKKITKSTDTYNFFKPFFEECMEQYEQSFAMVLNRQNVPMGIINIGSGSACGTVMDVQRLLRIAILMNAQGVIIAHNHPSGNLNASAEDKTMTQKIKQACKVMDINLLDHIILTKDSYYSFADNEIF